MFYLKILFSALKYLNVVTTTNDIIYYLHIILAYYSKSKIIKVIDES